MLYMVYVLQQENNQTTVLIKYFCQDSNIDFIIGLAQSSNGIFPVTFQTVRPEECRWRNLESEMGKKDLTYMLGGDGGRTRQKYRCKADGCQVTPMGVNLANLAE